MTIVVERRQKIDRTISPLREAADRKLASIQKHLIAQQKKENKLKGAAIRRYAKKHGLDLAYYRKPWIFRRIEGRVQIAMPAGYFAEIDGVLHQIVAK